MNWRSQIDKEILNLKITETELSIQALQTKLRRLKLEREEYDDDEEIVRSIKTDDTEELERTNIGIKDREEQLIYTGDTVELFTSSKATKYFKKGDEARVERKFGKDRVLISALEDRRETTNRTGYNLRVTGNIKGRTISNK